MKKISKRILELGSEVHWIVLIFYDFAAVIVSSYMPLVIRYEFAVSEIPRTFIEHIEWFLPFGIVATLLAFYLLRLYQNLWAYVGVTEVQNIVA